MVALSLDDHHLTHKCYPKFNIILHPNFSYGVGVSYIYVIVRLVLPYEKRPNIKYETATDNLYAIRLFIRQCDLFCSTIGVRRFKQLFILYIFYYFFRKRWQSNALCLPDSGVCVTNSTGIWLRIEIC